MGTSAKVLLFAIFSVVLVLFMSHVSYVGMNEQDNDSALKNSTRNALSQSVNLGSVRVNEEVSINPDIAEEALIRMYAENSSYLKGTRTLNIRQISSEPAMIAVDSYNTIENETANFINFFNSTQTVSAETNIRDREIVIFEAKDFIR